MSKFSVPKLTADAVYKLSSGHTIPVIGLGVFLTPPHVAHDIVYEALKKGYRHFDSAQYYGNENEVGDGIIQWLKENPQAKREDIFYTTKIKSPENIGYEKTLASARESLEKVKGLRYIDLLLIHAPFGNKTLRLGSWKALQELVEEGVVKSIGVSNYGNHHLQELLDWEGLTIKPVINQIELNPWLMRQEIVDFDRKNDVILQAYSPITRGMRLDDPDLLTLSKKYGKSPAQILIRWSLQQGFVTLPKTVNPDRLVSNLDVFDFNIEDEDVKLLSHPESYYVTLDYWDPSTYRD